MPSTTNHKVEPRSARRPESSKGNGFGGATQQAKKLLMDREQLEILQNNLRVIRLYVNSRHLEMLSPVYGGDALYTSQVCSMDKHLYDKKGIVAYQVTKLMYNEDENTYEKLCSVYSALNSFGGIVAMILQSDGKNTKLYLCTNTNGDGEIAGELLAGNIRGQFPGCEINRLSEREKSDLLDSYGTRPGSAMSKTVRSLSMIPARREDERQHDRMYSAQGYEKFVDAMNGRKYTLVVLSQRVADEAMESCLTGLESLYTMLSPYAKETVSYGKNESDAVSYSISTNVSNSFGRSISKSFGTSHTNSVSQGTNVNKGRGYEFFDIHFNSGEGSSYGSARTSGTNYGKSDSENYGENYGSAESENKSTTTGSSQTITLNRDNKTVQGLLLKLEENIKRIGASQTFGMWNSACYVIADDVATATMATSTLASLFSGDSQTSPRAYYNQWDVSSQADRSRVLDYLQHLQHPVIDLTMYKEITDGTGAVTRSAYQTEQVTPAMMISGKEIPTLMGLPRKSVPGIVVDSMAEFGRNISESWKSRVKKPILFGNVYHMGRIETTQTHLDLDTFASHMFICGASGSGKSNTTYNLLQKLIENKVPFLVIEPAKGEYKVEFAGLPGVNIFTADDSAYRRLRINPFEFGQGIHIREHLDNILQVISACWPLYGAMPGLLKQAFERVYIAHGWDLEHSERIVNRGTKFPVFKDLQRELEKVIDESPYSNQTKSDYKGALLNRVSSLCNGFEGEIFGKSLGIPDRALFNENTIIDLSSIGSDETRSLIMGILIIKLRNYRKSVTTEFNVGLKHVTVLEEAHNILKRCSKEQGQESGNVQGAAVSGLARCIAEMRSSGEGFMIIDQSPGEVDESAIKNTAIKIVMRLPSKTDCEEIGAALSLNENQIRELSRLDIGVAAIYHAGWTDTMLAKMGDIWDKRYRMKKAPGLNITTFTRVQGAVVQLLYQSLIEGDLSTAYQDVKELLNHLCTGPNALQPVLPVTKQKELLDEIRVFLTENDDLIAANRQKELKRVLFDFIIDFLRFESVMRLFPLTDVPTDIPNPMEESKPMGDKVARKIIAWEKDVRAAFVRYLNMPAECNPVRAYRWPVDPVDGEYFAEIYVETLMRYAKRYKDFRYCNAMDYLQSKKHFSKIGKRK